MSANDGGHSIESILQLIFDGRESEALSAISLEFGQSALEEVRLSPTIIAGKPEGEDAGRRDRVRLANLYRLSVFLVEKELWQKAVTAFTWTIKLSEDMDDIFFIESSRFNKAFCHKKLDQRLELQKEKEMISSDETFLVGYELLGIRDLD